MYQLSSGHPPSATRTEATAELEWKRLLSALWRHRRIFFAVAVPVFACVLAWTLLAPTKYTTHVKLIAGTGASSSGQVADTTLPVLNALLAASGVQTSETYAELFQEGPVADQVVKTLGLPISSGELLSHVAVKPIINTNLLDLSVTWSDAEKSAAIANAFAAAFVDRERSLIAMQADAAMATLSKQLPSAQRNAGSAENDLMHFETKNNLADIQIQTQNTINEVATVDAKIKATQVDQQQASAQLASITSQLASTAPTIGGQTSVAPNPVLGQLQTQLAQATVQLRVAEQQYTSQHPAVVALQHQTDDLRREIAQTPATVVASANTVSNPLFQQLTQQAATLRAQIASDGAQLSELAKQQTAMAPTVNGLPAKALQLLELQRRAKLSTDVLTALEQKWSQASITKTTAISDVTITEPATAGGATVRPNRVLNIVVGLFLSIVLGAVATLVFYFFDRRIRDERQLEEELELPVLASMPLLTSFNEHMKHQLHGHREPLKLAQNGNKTDDPWLRAFAVESLLQLVTYLRYSTNGEDRVRCLTITSASEGDGKSTIAISTAIAMANIEPRVLLIDGDLRKPTLHAKLDMERGRGLSDVLIGRSDAGDVTMPTQHAGLDILTSGSLTTNSVTLIQSERFDRMLEGLLKTYTTIIIDAPALNPVIDAAILAAKSDGTVVVVSMDNGDSVGVKRALAKLRHLGVKNIVGTVANRARPTKGESYSDYFATGHPSATKALT